MVQLSPEQRILPSVLGLVGVAVRSHKQPEMGLYVQWGPLSHPGHLMRRAAAPSATYQNETGSRPRALVAASHT